MKIFLRKMLAIMMILCLIFSSQSIQTFANETETETTNESVQETEEVENVSDDETSEVDVEETEEIIDEATEEIEEESESEAETELDETTEEEVEIKEASKEEKANNNLYGTESDLDEGFTGITASEFQALTSIDSDLCLTESVSLENNITVTEDATL